jgi:N-acetylglucosaminyldiphosphoundecaprenol N-acetyl-beta-D-mannosaminyltransferase
MRKLIVILGIPIDDLDMGETLTRLETLIREGRASGKGHQVVTVNADFVVKASQDADLRHLLQNSDMATADGMPLVWGARLLGVRLRGRVTGADLVPALAGSAALKGFSVYFLGAAPGVAARAAEILTARYPGLKVAGICAPSIPTIEDTPQSIIDDIRAAKPDILLVAFGNPKQEKWIGKFGPMLNVPVMIGVGGSLDFITGKTRRAPVWMQRTGLEWLYRLLQEPRRLWQRYAVDMVVFSTFFWKQLWAMRRGWVSSINPKYVLPSALPHSDLLMLEDTAIIHTQGQFTAASCEAFRSIARQALEATPYVIVNLENTEFMDSSAIGALVGLTRQAREAGGEVWLINLRKDIRATLELLRLDTFFSIQPGVTECLADRQSKVVGKGVPLPHLSGT